MKIRIEEIELEKEEEILIKTHDRNNEWVKYVLGVNERNTSIIGIYNERTYRLSIKDIYYFESVDGKSFIYSKSNVFQSKLKLYEIESILENQMFFRASKSMIVNAKMIKNIRPSLSGRFEIELVNNEKIMVSRHYVSNLKSILGL